MLLCFVLAVKVSSLCDFVQIDACVKLESETSTAEFPLHTSCLLENRLIIVRLFSSFTGLCTRRAGIKIHENQTFVMQKLLLNPAFLDPFV